MARTELSKDEILAQLHEIISLTEDSPSSEQMKYIGVHTGFIMYRMTGIFEYAFYRLMDDLKALCDSRKEEGLEARDEVLKVIEGLDSDDDYFVEHLVRAVRELDI